MLKNGRQEVEEEEGSEGTATSCKRRRHRRQQNKRGWSDCASPGEEKETDGLGLNYLRYNPVRTGVRDMDFKIVPMNLFFSLRRRVCELINIGRLEKISLTRLDPGYTPARVRSAAPCLLHPLVRLHWYRLLVPAYMSCFIRALPVFLAGLRLAYRRRN
jgi:hypothetical protein